MIEAQTVRQMDLDALDAVVKDLWQRLHDLEQLNGTDSSIRCRELSLAITNIEQGMHWIVRMKHD